VHGLLFPCVCSGSPSTFNDTRQTGFILEGIPEVPQGRKHSSSEEKEDYDDDCHYEDYFADDSHGSSDYGSSSGGFVPPKFNSYLYERFFLPLLSSYASAYYYFFPKNFLDRITEVRKTPAKTNFGTFVSTVVYSPIKLWVYIFRLIIWRYDVGYFLYVSFFSLPLLLFAQAFVGLAVASAFFSTAITRFHPNVKSSYIFIVRSFEKYLKPVDLYSKLIVCGDDIIPCEKLALAAAALLVMVAIHKTFKTSSQGAIGSKIEGIVNEISPVPPVVSIPVPWATNTPETLNFVQPRTFKISSSENSLLASLVSPSLMVVPFHFFDRRSYGEKYVMREGDPFQLYLNNETIDLSFNPRLLYQPDASLDICFYHVTIPCSWFSIYPDLTNNSSSFSELVELKGRKCSATSNGKKISVKDPQTILGDCGSLIVRGNQIVGIHVAITFTGMGIGICLSKQMVSSACGHFTRVGIPNLLTNLELPPDSELILQGLENLDVVKNFDWKWCHKLAGDDLSRNDHVPLGCHRLNLTPAMTSHETTMHGTFSPYCQEYFKAPVKHAVLYEGVYRSSVVNRMTQYGFKQNLETPLFAAIDVMLSDLPHIQPIYHPINMYTAFHGTSESIYVNPKDVDKAPGAHIKHCKLTRETAYVKETFDSPAKIAPKVMARMEYMLQCMKEGKMVLIFMESCPKDEPVNKKKVLMNKCRYFFVCESEWNTVIKMYFAPLVSYLYREKEKSGYFGSINAGSRDWDELAKHLNFFGEGETNCIDADQETFDLRHSGFMITAFARYCQLVALKIGYTQEEADITARMAINSFKYILKMEGVYYLCSSRLCSGLFITLFMNGFVTMVLMYTFIMSKGFDPLLHCRIATVGDDLLAAFSAFLRAAMTTVELQEHNIKYGYSLTPSTKDSEFINFVPLTSTSFVKRAFVKEGDRWKAPIALESVYKSLSYSIQCSVSQAERDKGALDSAIREMFLHGRKAFDDFMVLADRHPHSPYTYDLLHELWSNNSFILWDGSSINFDSIPQAGPVWPKTAKISEAENLTVMRFFPKFTEWSYEHAPLPQERLKAKASSKHDPVEQGLSGGITSPTSINSDVLLITNNNSSVVSTVSTIYSADVTKESQQDRVVSEDEGMNFRKIFSRKRLVYTETIASTGVTNTSPDLFALWLAMPQVDKLVSQYTYYRGSMRVLIVYTGNPSIFGKIRVSATPGLLNTGNGVPSITLPAITNQTRTSQLPHVDLDLSVSCT
jgi:hypothetical protein